MNSLSPWRAVSLRSRIIFLFAVFCVFACIGFVRDITDLGRQPVPRFVATVVLFGLFAACYAASGIVLRQNFWKALLPLFALQFLLMGLLANFFPDAPRVVQLNAAEVVRLHSRLAFDAGAINLSIVLGYVGFVYVSVSEARKYLRTQTEKAALEGEMAAAHEIQRVMVPQDLPTIRCYAVESVYLPAEEVGGDFFQVVSLKSGRTLIVIGDVSGKGLRAAMIVSMIVGMLGTLSGFTDEPAEILDELNRRLCSRTHGGFATCLALCLDNDGRLTLANAGHPAPYLNGKEIPFTGSMPLGLVQTARYSQTCLEIALGDRVVLLTDGIPEAKNQQGALLGFPTVAALLREGANVRTVAEAAQRFGQNDDLTVISIARTA
jgi:hypothetical protein